MVLGCNTSQLHFESQGEQNDPKQNIEQEQSNAFGKRSRLLGSDRNDDASKKARIPEDSTGGSHAVPDVADAIEDLLAQSNKIQDLKSPGTSGCNQSVFPPDHSILGQGHVDSHPTFGLSRHWLNRKIKEGSIPNPSGHGGKPCTYDALSETHRFSATLLTPFRSLFHITSTIRC